MVPRVRDRAKSQYSSRSGMCCTPHKQVRCSDGRRGRANVRRSRRTDSGNGAEGQDSGADPRHCPRRRRTNTRGADPQLSAKIRPARSPAGARGRRSGGVRAGVVPQQQRRATARRSGGIELRGADPQHCPQFLTKIRPVRSPAGAEADRAESGQGRCSNGGADSTAQGAATDGAGRSGCGKAVTAAKGR
jgi:hypothetical protein